MKIGVLGGTFNPPHIGHLILAETVRQKLKLDKVFFVPANLPPHKDVDIVDAYHRLRMVKLAIKGNPYFSALDWEIKRGGQSYTVDTVQEFRRKFTGSRIFLIIGSDLADKFNTWKDYRRIKEMAEIAVVERENFPFRKEKGFLLVKMVEVGINSSLVREFIAEGISVKYMVPEEVLKYIRKHRLYVNYRSRVRRRR